MFKPSCPIGDQTNKMFVLLTIQHCFSFELSEAVPGISGCTFSLEGIPKGGVTFANYGNKLETGTDFR